MWDSNTYNISLESVLTASILVTPTLNIQWFNSSQIIVIFILRHHDRANNSPCWVCHQDCHQTTRVLDKRPWPLVPSCRVCLPKCSNHSIPYQIQSCGAKTPSEHHDLCQRPDYKLSVLFPHSFWGSQGQASVLIHPLTLAAVIHHPGLGDGCPTALMNTMLALLPDKVQAVYFWACFWKGYPSRWGTTWWLKN